MERDSKFFVSFVVFTGIALLFLLFERYSYNESTGTSSALGNVLVSIFLPGVLALIYTFMQRFQGASAMLICITLSCIVQGFGGLLPGYFIYVELILLLGLLVYFLFQGNKVFWLVSSCLGTQLVLWLFWEGGVVLNIALDGLLMGLLAYVLIQDSRASMLTPANKRVSMAYLYKLIAAYALTLSMQML